MKESTTTTSVHTHLDGHRRLAVKDTELSMGASVLAFGISVDGVPGPELVGFYFDHGDESPLGEAVDVALAASMDDLSAAALRIRHAALQRINGRKALATAVAEDRV